MLGGVAYKTRFVMANGRILVVDDEESLCEILQFQR